MRLADKGGGEGSRGGSSLPRDSNGEGASVLGEPGRTLEVASSVTATRLVWGGQTEDGTSAAAPGHTLRSAGLGASRGSCLLSCIHQALLACSLEFSSSPGQKRAEQTTAPPSPPAAALPPPSSHQSVLNTHRLSGQLRAQTLWCWVRTPSPGLFLGTGVFPPLTVLSGCQDGICLRVGTGLPGPLGPGTLVFHSRKDSRVLPS